MNTAWWNVVITLASVGYGDIYPRTNIGRIITFILCICGVSIISLLVLAIQNYLVMDKQEYKSFLLV